MLDYLKQAREYLEKTASSSPFEWNHQQALWRILLYLESQPAPLTEDQVREIVRGSQHQHKYNFTADHLTTPPVEQLATTGSPTTDSPSAVDSAPEAAPIETESTIRMMELSQRLLGMMLPEERSHVAHCSSCTDQLAAFVSSLSMRA